MVCSGTPFWPCLYGALTSCCLTLPGAGPGLAVVHRLRIGPYYGHGPWMLIFLHELDQALEEHQSLVLGAYLLHSSISRKVIYNNLPRLQLISRKEHVKIQTMKRTR